MSSDSVTTGAPDRPSPGLRDLPELVEGAAGPGRLVDLVERGTPSPVSPGTALTVYRVVQESLTNTLKHADPPTRTDVELEWGADSLTVTVVDDGRPREARAGHPEPEPGRGLRGLRERVEQAGGRFETGSREAGGWRTAATLPIRPGAASVPSSLDDGPPVAHDPEPGR